MAYYIIQWFSLLCSCLLFTTVQVTPTTLSCRISLTYGQNAYIDLKCETTSDYPSLQATLHRRELDHINFDPNASGCKFDNVGTGSSGNYHGNCTWRIPFSSLLENNTFYVEMVAVVNNTPVGTRVFSSDKIVNIGLPNVIIYGRNCPVGPGVTGVYIKIGTVATCRCDLVSSGLVSGSARWYTRDGVLVKTQTAYGQYSILRFSYNASDPKQAYDCRADNPTLSYYHLEYTPIFSTSPPQSLISGLLLVMGISLALQLA
ncbi:hypothetical protein BsWGS_12388 [Bradybaena similaris]